jgi:predicted phosphodiesterase
MGLFGTGKTFFAKCRPLMPEVLSAYGFGGGGKSRENRRVAIFGDVHANLEALTAVLRDAEQQGVEQFACTGDLVGYGPDPSECLEIIKQLGCPVVKGNHDDLAATEGSLKDFTLHAMNALLWTREHLSAEERAWLNALPMEWGEGISSREQETAKDDGKETSSFCGSMHLVHSSVFEPEVWRYIITPEEAEKVLPLQKPGLVFFGHTHMPSVYAFHPDTGKFRSTMPSPEGVLELEPEWKWLVNPGSVGQPRDLDPRAAYLIFDPDACTIEQRRVEYDYRKTAKKIVDAGLPERNAQRLYKGR